jgi:hypothetical protein
VWAGFLVICFESCRVAIARAGMNLSQAIVVFFVEIGCWLVRVLRSARMK